MGRPYPQVHPHVLVRGDAAAGGGGGGGPSVGFPFKGAKVILTAAEAISTSTDIPWDAVSYDVGTWWSSGAPTRLTIPAGVTRIRMYANIRTDDNSFILTLAIIKNGSVWAEGPMTREDRQRTEQNLSSGPINVVEGDYFEIQAASSSAQNAIVSNTWFSIEAIETVAPSTTRRGALVHLTADKTAQNHSAGKTIDFDDETNGYDTDNIHDNVTNPSRLTVPAGVTQVRLTGSCALQAVTSADSARVQIKKNGAWAVGLPLLITDVVYVSPWYAIAGAIIDVVAGDYFEFWLDTETDTSITISAGSWFSMEIVEPVLVAREASRGCLVTDASVQTMSHNVWTPINFDTQDYDTDAIHDPVTLNTRLTVPVGVTKIRLTAAFAWQSIQPGGRALRMTKNGTAGIGLPRNEDDTVTILEGHMALSSAIVRVTGGDYFELEAWHNKGVSINNLNSHGLPWFSMEIIE